MTRRTILFGCIGALSLLVPAAPGLATGTRSESPIVVQRILFSHGSGHGGQADFEVTYRNNGARTVSRVEFSIATPDGFPAVVEDVGTFSQGVPIHRDFHVQLLGEQSPNETATVLISEVQFADGSTWMPAAGAAAISVMGQ